MTSPATNDNNVGILAIEVYTPHNYIDQSELETHENVSAGKYTIGLGQQGIAVVNGDREDINSICLTVVHRLLEKYNIDLQDIGRLEVGTETLVDKSKSTKTVLMDLFAKSGNTDLEGATIVNACYGGTAALLNAFTWCDSQSWDGRYAIVVAGDIATYEKGPARPTGGIGTVAMLVGRDASLVCDLRLRTTHASNVWDFYKPDHTVEYPTVDGVLSQICYYQAIEDVYTRFCTKMEKSSKNAIFDATQPDYFVFHSPYNKLVQKSYARLFFVDALRRKQQQGAAADDEALKEYLEKPITETYTDKNLEKLLKTISEKYYMEKMKDSNYASQWIGNTYTASVFFGLASLIDRLGNETTNALTPGKSIIMFSYGSGALASMYQLQVREPTSSRHQEKFTVSQIAKQLQLTDRLVSRNKIHANELDVALDIRKKMHNAGAPYQPIYPTVGKLLPGTYYLQEMDAQFRRTYLRIPLLSGNGGDDVSSVMDPSPTLAPSQVMEEYTNQKQG